MERTWGSRRILKAVSRYTTSLCVDWLPARFAQTGAYPRPLASGSWACIHKVG